MTAFVTNEHPSKKEILRISRLNRLLDEIEAYGLYNFLSGKSQGRLYDKNIACHKQRINKLINGMLK